MIKNERVYFSLLEFEKKLFHWLIWERHKIILIIFIALLMWGLSYLPYVNLFVSSSLVIFVVIVMSLVLFKVYPDWIIILALLLFLPALLSVLLGDQEAAESIGGYIYGIFFVAVVKLIINTKTNHLLKKS